MSISLDEQEVTINISRIDEYATIYCSDSTWITKMDKLVSKNPSLFSVIRSDEHGKTYIFPKKLVSIRSSIIKRELTDEQKELARERLKNARQNKQNN